MMCRRINRAALLPVVLLLLTSLVSASDLSRARELEESGDVAAAIALYKTWIADNPGDESSLAVVLHTADLEPVLLAKIELLSSALAQSSEPESRNALLVARGRIQEIVGDLASAQESYQEASFVVPGKKDLESLLSSARLLFEIGEFRDAEAQARGMLQTVDDAEVRTDAAVILSRVYAATEREGRAVETIRQVLGSSGDGSALLWAVHLARLTEDADLEADALEQLEANHQGSMELALAVGTIDALPSASQILGLGGIGPAAEVALEQTQTVASDTRAENQTVLVESAEPEYIDIQTGSFLVRENAEYALKDLRGEGFEAILRERRIEEKLFFRVVLPEVPAAEVQQTLVRLKERGFEGYPLYN